jgi:16S rRNA processing protein RimM
VAAELFTDFPERFADRRRLFLLDANGTRRELHLQDFWPHKEWMILKFEGIDSINDAEPLKGAEIQIPAEERAPLEEGAAYVGDLVGCHVFVLDRPATADLRPTLREVGIVFDVTFSAGEAPILQIKEGKREHMVPLAQEYIKSLDTAAKRIELELPEGMLDLDAPLSSEEKRAHQNPEESDQ